MPTVDKHSNERGQIYTVRFNIRVRPDQAELIERAAAAAYKHPSSFFRDAAVKEAERILKRAALDAA